MKKLLVLLLLTAPALGQVVIKANTTANPFPVLAGSTRQINVNILVDGQQCTAGKESCKVNWSVASTKGGASATFTDPSHADAPSINAALPTIQVNIGSTPGKCSITPESGEKKGPFTFSSTWVVVVQAQSVDDPTKTASFQFNVCANAAGNVYPNGEPTVPVFPAYQQAFKNQAMTIQSYVQQCSDETGTWAIAAQPAGGDGALADTNHRDTVFTASVTGRYTVTYKANCNGAIGSAIVYVSPNAMPPYTATPNKTMPHECYVDPAFKGPDFEIGEGKKYPTIASTPSIDSILPGTIFRLWNTDTTGSNPSVFHEYYDIQNPGTDTQPIIFCGVPDSHGNLPIMDGENAVARADVSTAAAAGFGIMSFWNGPSHYGYWQGGAFGPHYVSFTGIHVRNGKPPYMYTPPRKNVAVKYPPFLACVNVRSGTFIDISGDDLDNCSIGFFSDDNGNNAYATISQNIYLRGNHIHRNGLKGNMGVHQVYAQTFHLVFEGNLVDDIAPGANGGQFKDRGVETILRYNAIGAGDPAARWYDGVADEGGGHFHEVEGYIFYLWAVGDSAGPDVMAGYQEAWQKTFLYGNLEYYSGENAVHYAYDSFSGMNSRNGTLYFYNNTLSAVQKVFDNGENGSGGNTIFPPRIFSANNIFWTYPPCCGQGQLALNHYAGLILTNVTNLYKTGSMSIKTPIMGGDYSAGTAIGWASECDNGCVWPLTLPLNAHMYGISPANFLTTAKQPFNNTTLSVPLGSAAINAGTALTGIPAQLPVRFQYDIRTSTMIPRTQPLTIGAEGYVPPTNSSTASGAAAKPDSEAH